MRWDKRFLLVDDHRLFLEGMKYLLERLEGEIRVDTADTVAGALHLFDRGTEYDLLLLDLSLPDMDGFSLISSLSQRGIILPVIIVSSTSDVVKIREGLAKGASGFIHKNASADEMLEAIRGVLEGRFIVPQHLRSQLDISQHNNVIQNVVVESEQSIGDRQIEVLKLIDEGMSNKQIARVLNISEATVKYHLAILFKHFGAKNRTACLVKARQSNSLVN